MRNGPHPEYQESITITPRCAGVFVEIKPVAGYMWDLVDALVESHNELNANSSGNAGTSQCALETELSAVLALKLSKEFGEKVGVCIDTLVGYGKILFRISNGQV